MPFKKGQSGNPHGRTPGVKDRVPRGSLRAAVKKLALDHPDAIFKALRAGVKTMPGAHQYLRIIGDVEEAMPDMPNRERTVVNISLRPAHADD